MVRTVTHEDILAAGPGELQIVEVLGKSEYDRIHIQGAINIPLQVLDRQMAEQLDRDRRVVVYCFDAY